MFLDVVVSEDLSFSFMSTLYCVFVEHSDAFQTLRM